MSIRATASQNDRVANNRASLKTGASEFRQQHEKLAALWQRSIETGADAS